MTIFYIYAQQYFPGYIVVNNSPFTHMKYIILTPNRLKEYSDSYSR